ncbi:MAG: hypothetical protein CSA35_01470 [Dethiosulfovibrio peptidovorans]|nr:MAG: hypothetical protein CSA35_01470 [Dethiosulfovibrio peptidovorans]
MIQVMLVDDHQMVLDGLKQTIDAQDDMVVTALATSGEQALEFLSRVAVQVAVIDVTMPGMNGVTLTRKIREGFPEVRIIALSMHVDGLIVSEMLKVGAQGYVLKDCGAESLLVAIRGVAQGGVFFSTGVGALVVREYIQARDFMGEPRVPELTEREQEILRLLMQGKRVQEIEMLLCISRHTVNTHRGNIMTKLGCETFVDLVRYCIREGICGLE